MNDYTKDIEVLEDIDDASWPMSNFLAEVKYGVVKKAITALKALQSAKEELPCRKDVIANGDGKGHKDEWSEGVNHVLDKITPIYAKLKLENEESKKYPPMQIVICPYAPEAKILAECPLKEQNVKLRKEIANSNKVKFDEVTKNTIDYLEKREKQLLQELRTLKDKITVDGIYLIMLSTRLKKDEEREKTYAQAIVKELKGEK